MYQSVMLESPVTALYGVSNIYASRLKRLGITTIESLLYHIPFRFEDFSLISKIHHVQVGEKVTVVGIVKDFKNVFTKNGKRIQTATISDETGEIEVVWYNQPYLASVLKKGINIGISGETQWFGHKLTIQSPEYEIIRPTHWTSPEQAINNLQPTTYNPQLITNLVHMGRLVPVYPETEGLSSKWLRAKIHTILNVMHIPIPEFLPEQIQTSHNLLPLSTALLHAHFPNTPDEASEAKRRLAFDELFLMQLASLKRRREWAKKQVTQAVRYSPYKKEVESFISGLPFSLTSAQLRSIHEILGDIEKPTPMNRLLEGDVGSGKTVVAAIGMYVCYLNGYQSVLMAPTEILATQHFQTISLLLAPLGIRIALFTGKTPGKTDKNQEHADVYVGTHALIYDSVKFKNPAFIVIDEQQRFGVLQRTQLRQKTNTPHLLSMTATPIPRTAALTMYGDLDLSLLDEMPQGRKVVKTWVVPNEKRQSAYAWIKRTIFAHSPPQQVFVVCPFIDDSETLGSVKSAKSQYNHLKDEVFSGYRVALLHGKMKAKEKEHVLTKFRKIEYDILVATPVVEVGIDIPNATLIIIEGAERFGLAQLHQLRGRVGRSSLPSYCLLFTEKESQNTQDRLKLLESIHNGPELAEYDLKLRGAGDLYGTKQHGMLEFRFAEVSDTELIAQTQRVSTQILDEYPTLASFPLLREKLLRYTIQSSSPD